jgi:hypothetical protein
MNCPNCGKKSEVTTRDFIFALMQECGARISPKPQFCSCLSNLPKPHFISGNWLTEDRATKKGDIWFRIWQMHNLPEMRDCRTLGYRYAVVGDRVICEATGDYYDVTGSILEEVQA